MRNSKNTDIRQVLPVVQAPALVLHRTGDQVEAIEAGRYVASRIRRRPVRRTRWRRRDPVARRRRGAGVRNSRTFSRAERAPRKGAIAVSRPCSSRTLLDRRNISPLSGTPRGVERLREHDRIVERAILRHGGRKIDSAGDGVFATFDGPAAAVRCAQGIIEAVRALGFEIRAGVHTGEVEADGARVRRRCRSPRRAHRRGGKSLAGAGVIDSARPYRGEWPDLRGRRASTD